MADHGSYESKWGRTGEFNRAECFQFGPAAAENSAIVPIRPEFSRPFVWQYGRRLLLLEREVACWVFAELEFDPQRCRYIELRRVRYRWEREAVGALLSRTLAYGEEVATVSAQLLDSWIRCRR